MSIEARGPTLPRPADAGFWMLDRAADALEPLQALVLPRGAHPLGRVWTDTRSLEPGDLFVAAPGARADGRRFAPQAIERGAVAVLASI